MPRSRRPVLDRVSPRPGPRLRRAAVAAIATVGFGLNFWAWTLLAPFGSDPDQVDPPGGWSRVLLVAVPVVVGALGRIPVGALTDRYGARVMFPAVSVAAAVGVLALATADSVPVLFLASCALGVAGTAFAVGAALVCRAHPPGRRGFALGVYGAGMGGFGAAVLTSRLGLVDPPGGLTSLAVLLLAYAALAAAVIRDPQPRPARPESIRRIALAVWRLPPTRGLAAAYAVSFGGLIAFGLFTPAFAHGEYQLPWRTAVLGTAAVVCLGALARPVGGWLCDRNDPIRILTACYAAVAGLTLLLAFRPPLPAAAATAVGMVVGLGAASGTVLALIGRTAPMHRIGVICGTVGAAGGLASLLPPLLLAAVFAVTGSFAIGLTVLAGLASGAAASLCGRGRWRGAALAFPVPADPDQAGTTVVALDARDAARNSEGVLAVLAGLAAGQELVIAYGHPGPSAAGTTAPAFVAQLRMQLPLHTVIAALVDTPPRRRECELLGDLLNEGCIAVAISPAGDLAVVAGLLAQRLGADSLLHLTHDHTDGVRMDPSPYAGAGTSGR